MRIKIKKDFFIFKILVLYKNTAENYIDKYASDPLPIYKWCCIEIKKQSITYIRWIQAVFGCCWRCFCERDRLCATCKNIWSTIGRKQILKKIFSSRIYGRKESKASWQPWPKTYFNLSCRKTKSYHENAHEQIYKAYERFL